MNSRKIFQNILQAFFPFGALVSIYSIRFFFETNLFRSHLIIIPIASLCYAFIIRNSADRKILFLYFYIVMVIFSFPILIWYWSKGLVISLLIPAPFIIYSAYQWIKPPAKWPVTTLIFLIYLGILIYAVGQASLKRPDKKIITQINQQHLDAFVKDGKRISFKSEQIYLMEYYTYWCGPCLQKLKALKPLTSEFPQVKFVIVHCAALEEKGKKLPSTFLDNYPGFELWTDPDTSLVSQFSEGSIPLTIIMNGNGKVYDHEVGYLPKESIQWLRLTLPEADRANLLLFENTHLSNSK